MHYSHNQNLLNCTDTNFSDFTIVKFFTDGSKNGVVENFLCLFKTNTVFLLI